MRHGAAVVGDEQELGVGRQLAQQRAEPLHVGVVERCVDLVEQAERRRADAEQRQQERHRGERLLTARQQQH